MRLPRRRLLSVAALAPIASLWPRRLRSARRGAAAGAPAGVTLADVAGLSVGHHTRADRPTGCTVVIAREGATAGVAVRGAAPGTREIALLAPENTVQRVHAVLLAGGSAFGLAAADGVVRWLREQGVGFPITGGPVPIVPAAILFDLGVGGGTSTPDAGDGYAACQAAGEIPLRQGNVGAGAGATVGKMAGGRPMKGGIGSAGFRFADGTVVAALVAVNCRGDVRDPHTGRLLAGALDEQGGLLDAEARLLDGAAPASGGGREAGAAAGAATTIGVVATNRTLAKVDCHRLAGVAHDGLARAVVPAHTRLDGDTLFFLATGKAAEVRGVAEFDRLEAAAAAAVADAIVAAVTAARSLPGLPAARELGTI